MQKMIPMGKRVLFFVLFGLLFAVLILGFVGGSVRAAGYSNVTVSDAKTMIDSNPFLVALDVRNESEYDTGHVRNAKLIPVTELAGRLNELNATNEILVYCKSGERSTQASQILADANFSHVYNMLGGITSWINAGYPVYVKYSSIQEAINSANEGSAIRISSGLYQEHLTVNKSIALIGENRDTTIIDGTGNGTVFYVRADNVSISDFMIQNSGCACYGYCGIHVEGYHQNINVTDNHLHQDGFGIKMEWVRRVVIEHNDMTNSLDWSVIVSNSSEILVLENSVSNGFYGIEIVNATDLTVSGNAVVDCLQGLDIYASDNGSFVDNTFYFNGFHGIYLDGSNNNWIFHNNFVKNNLHISSHSSTNFWDNGFEGNFWDNYAGVDDNLDGIGDTPRTIDGNDIDNHPLMGAFSSFRTSVRKYVEVVSNSTVEDFGYFEYNSTIRMHVSNMTVNQTHGFCRLTIPHNIMSPPYNVTINGNPVSYNTILENETLSIIYFSYEHSTLEIIVIPEFPSQAVLLLFMLAIPVAATVHRRKKSFNPGNHDSRPTLNVAFTKRADILFQA
jgi:parallel beta-helix repeat protein